MRKTRRVYPRAVNGLTHSQAAKRMRTPEYQAVASHLKYIRAGKASYIGMPFYDAWNPQFGGSVVVGERWIIEHIGYKPAGCDCHIIDRRIGFVPGNLCWIPKASHRRAEMLERTLIQAENLRIEVANSEFLLSLG